jgi:hypothetical protein
LEASLVEDIKFCWYDILSWGVQMIKKDTLKAVLCKLGWSAALYHIWKQRNDIWHGNIPRLEERILIEIKWEIRSRVVALADLRDQKENEKLCCSWGIPTSIFDV